MFETPLDEQKHDHQWQLREAHGELLLDRLLRLNRVGYRAALEAHTGVFELVHPNKRAIPVALWPDGQVVDKNPTAVQDGSRTIISPEDERRFALFLAQVPPPSMISRILAVKVGEVLAALAAVIVLLLIGGTASAVAKWGWQFLTGNPQG